MGFLVRTWNAKMGEWHTEDVQRLVTGVVIEETLLRCANVSCWVFLRLMSAVFWGVFSPNPQKCKSYVTHIRE